MTSITFFNSGHHKSTGMTAGKTALADNTNNRSKTPVHKRAMPSDLLLQQPSRFGTPQVRHRQMSSSTNYGLFEPPPVPFQYGDELTNLVNSFPPFGSSSITDAYQKTLASALYDHLPNNTIEAEPDQSGAFTGYIGYEYSGSYSGYNDAFKSLSLTTAAKQAVVMMSDVDFDYHSVNNLTKEIQSHVSVSIDTTRLDSDMSSFKSLISDQCTQLYIPTFQYEYEPTASAIACIPEEHRLDAANELDAAIKGDHFTANVNIAIANGGDSALQATWFLYNLWTCLTALNYPDVNAAIESYDNANLNVPYEVSAYHWDRGDYRSWFNASTGSYMNSPTITKTMPEKVTIMPVGGGYYVESDSVQNGYSHSFCEWGSLARYKPSSSCFTANTGVLMADGSVKNIKDVQKNDIVQTTRGPRAVLMVESPALGQRDLWNMNNLNLGFTEMHCFRVANGGCMKRVAVNEMVTMDSAPTMFMEGYSVGKCKPGCQILAKIRDGRSTTDATAVVESLSKQQVVKARSEGADGDGSRVYDIILEKWWADEPAYFVGGPDTFLAVDAETSNPTTDQPTSAAVLAAMDVMLAACDNTSTSPVALLTRACANIDVVNIERRAHGMAMRILIRDSAQSLQMPKASVFESGEGSWSELASFMEYFLISRYGRWLRSVIRVNAKAAVASTLPEDKLAVGIHDLELSGDHGVAANSCVRMEVVVFSESMQKSGSVVFRVDSQQTCHYLAIHKCCIFREADKFALSKLKGVMWCDEDAVARFECCIDVTRVHGRFLDLFLSTSDHKTIGRVGVSLRRVRENFKEWQAADPEMMLAKGVAVGRQLGYDIAAGLERFGGRKSFAKWLRPKQSK